MAIGKWLKVVTVAVLVVMLATGGVGCGDDEKLTQTPTPTATITPPPPLPTGWTLHSAYKFEIGLPADWIALEVTPEAIDAMIETMETNNPDYVPYLEALKQQEAIAFWALDPASPPGYAFNLNVMHEIRLVPLNEYAELMETQGESMGWTMLDSEQFSLRGYEALALEGKMTAATPSGQLFQAENKMVVVDHGGYRYLMNLTYLPEYRGKYKGLLNSVIQTFNIVG